MNKKIRILQVISALNVGGAETMLLNILKTIDKTKFELFFLCYSEEKYEYEDEIKQYGGTIVRIKPLRMVGPFNFMKQIKKVIKDYRIDVVHCHTYYNSMFAVLAAKKCGIKTIITHSHNTKPEKNPSLIKRTYFGISKYILNKYSTDRVACGVDAGHALFGKKRYFWVFNNGIILKDYSYSQKQRNEIRRQMGIKEDVIVLGHTGAFREQKNHSGLIDIFNAYQRQFPNTVLVLIGKGSLENDIKAKAKALGLQDKVMFLGLKKNAKQYYNAFDCFVFPSFYEGLPLVLIEAQANGLPIVASDTIDKNVNISNRIIFADIKNKDEWVKAISKSVRKRYMEKDMSSFESYDMSKEVKKLEDIYSRN